MTKKKITKDNLLWFLRMMILGLKSNLTLKEAGFGNLADEIEKMFNDTFEEILNEQKKETKTL